MSKKRYNLNQRILGISIPEKKEEIIKKLKVIDDYLTSNYPITSRMDMGELIKKIIKTDKVGREWVCHTASTIGGGFAIQREGYNPPGFRIGYEFKDKIYKENHDMWLNFNSGIDSRVIFISIKPQFFWFSLFENVVSTKRLWLEVNFFPGEKYEEYKRNMVDGIRSKLIEK